MLRQFDLSVMCKLETKLASSGNRFDVFFFQRGWCLCLLAAEVVRQSLRNRRIPLRLWAIRIHRLVGLIPFGAQELHQVVLSPNALSSKKWVLVLLSGFLFALYFLFVILG